MPRSVFSRLLPIVSTAWIAAVAVGAAQRRDVFVLSRDHPAIAYSTGAADNAATRLNARLKEGTARLTFGADNGYLPSVLEAFGISPASQALVFSLTSFQAERINMHNPRAVFFNDTVAVGWVRGGEVLEVAVQDPRQGALFYALEQKADAAPQLVRNNQS